MQYIPVMGVKCTIQQTTQKKGKSLSGKRCGGNHYECDYFCNGGKPNVGVYAKKEGEQK